MGGMLAHAAIAVGQLLAASATVSWQLDCELETRVAALRATGEPVSIADLKPAAIPDEVNAAVQLDRLTPRLNVYELNVRAFYRTPLGNELRQVNMAPQGVINPTTPRQVEVLREFLASTDDLDQMVLLASWCERYASTMDFSQEPENYSESLGLLQMRRRDIARMTDLRTRLLLADGLREEAIERWLIVLRLARLHTDESSLGHPAIAMRYFAINGINEALATGPVGFAARLRIEAELAAAYDPQRIERALRANRALSISITRERVAQMSGPLRRLAGWTITGPFLIVLDELDVALPEVARPWSDMDERVLAAWRRRPIYGMGVITWMRADRQDLARIRSLRVLNALGLFAATNGREAEGLGELLLPPETLADPLTTGSLVVRRRDDGKRVVYSVGPDGADNGGEVERGIDVGWASLVVTQ